MNYPKVDEGRKEKLDQWIISIRDREEIVGAQRV